MGLFFGSVSWVCNLGTAYQYRAQTGKQILVGSIVVFMKFIIEHTELDLKQMKAAPPTPEIIQKGTHCYYNILNPSNKVQCDQCKRDITKNAKVLAQDGDYCLGCFATAEEFPEEYHIINKLNYPLIDKEWTADEELHLFEGLQKHGFGNWSEIAEYLGTKSREDVEYHYSRYFLNEPDFLPSVPIISRRDSSGKIIQSCSDEDKKQKTLTNFLNSHSTPSFQRGSLTVNQMTAGMKTGNNPAEIVGYMPKRADFEVEFDNDAELLLAEMEFNEDDSQEERKMKFRLMDIYNEKLTERLRRKEFVISRKLLDLKEQMRLDKTRSKQEKEIYNMMKVFARFSTPEEHEELVQGIILEKQIRARLASLKEFKRKGFRSLADLHEDLDSKKKKEDRIKKDPIFLASERGKPPLPAIVPRKSKKQQVIEKVEGRAAAFPSIEEQQLCERMGLSVKEYQVIKQSLVRESIRQGAVEMDQVEKVFKLGRSQVKRVLDFLVQREDLLNDCKDLERPSF